MNRTFLIFICSISWAVILNGQTDAQIDTIFSKADKLRDKIESMHYFYRSADQFGIDPDTVRSYGKGYIQKIKDDSLGYKYNISDLKGKTRKIYDGKKIARVYDNYKTVRYSDPSKKGIRGAYHNTENVPYVFTNNYFADLQEDPLVNSIHLVSDTIIEGSLCYQVRVEYTSSNIFYSSVVHYFFNKDNCFCVGKQGFDSYAGAPRHSEFIVVFADVNGDLDEDIFKHYKNIPTKYERLKPYKSQKYVGPLRTNKKIPKFKGYTLDDKTITKDNLLNQITVLDFWYIGCVPCLAIAPTIDSIAINYKDRGVEVLGFNPYNEKEDIIKFKEFSQLTYESIIVDSDVPDKFKVPGYPTIFIINQEGRVAYSRVGGDNNLYTILAEQIDALLSSR